eukprot:Gb_28997 [translate_table: standard]
MAFLPCLRIHYSSGKDWSYFVTFILHKNMEGHGAFVPMNVFPTVHSFCYVCTTNHQFCFMHLLVKCGPNPNDHALNVVAATTILAATGKTESSRSMECHFNPTTGCCSHQQGCVGVDKTIDWRTRPSGLCWQMTSRCGERLLQKSANDQPDQQMTVYSSGKWRSVIVIYTQNNERLQRAANGGVMGICVIMMPQMLMLSVGVVMSIYASTHGKGKSEMGIFSCSYMEDLDTAKGKMQAELKGSPLNGQVMRVLLLPMLASDHRDIFQLLGYDLQSLLSPQIRSGLALNFLIDMG